MFYFNCQLTTTVTPFVHASALTPLGSFELFDDNFCLSDFLFSLTTGLFDTVAVPVSKLPEFISLLHNFDILDFSRSYSLTPLSSQAVDYLANLLTQSAEFVRDNF